MAISLLIVGHANTGKTSLIRTLMRDRQFGAIDNRSGTTRHVEKIDLMIDNQAVLHLIDTPGFEDSIGLWQTRSQGELTFQTGHQWLSYAANDPQLASHFEQEQKILKQLPKCQIILYVIDLRHGPLGKYLDEIDILTCANKPIVPILNFYHSQPNYMREWQQCLAERQLHAHVRFDTVAFFFSDECKLYQTLQSLMPDHYDQLNTLIKRRERDAEQRLVKVQQALAQMLIRSATFHRVCSSAKPQPSDIRQFEDSIRSIEQDFVQYCLDIYTFQVQDVALQGLAIDGNQWQQDVFDADTLKNWGLQTTTVAATGAAIGASIDILSAGLTLGTATGLGALIGAGWQTGQSFKSSVINRLRNRAVLATGTSTLIALLYRGTELINHLHHRGHAAQQAFTIDSSQLPDKEDISRYAKLFKKLAQRIEWQTNGTTHELPEHSLITQLNEEIQHLSNDR